MFPNFLFTQRKTKRKKTLSVSFFCTSLDVRSSLRPNRAKINKARSSTVRWKGNFSDFCKNGCGREHQSVSARRFLAIDDLSAGVERAWNLSFFFQGLLYRGLLLTANNHQGSSRRQVYPKDPLHPSPRVKTGILLNSSSFAFALWLFRLVQIEVNFSMWLPEKERKKDNGSEKKSFGKKVCDKHCTSDTNEQWKKKTNAFQLYELKSNMLIDQIQTGSRSQRCVIMTAVT